MSDATECPFCSDSTALVANGLAFAIPDRYPVNPGHVLLVPRRHVASFFDTTAAERDAMLDLAFEMRHRIDADLAPAGYNLGVNIGETAGQTVMHVHIHLIPRYRGDVDNPRGGVRGVIPARQAY